MSHVTLAQLDPKRLPKHIAIIMDGNGRWAQSRHRPRLQGHYRGAKVVSNIVEAASNLGISHLTLYAFSEENWSRPDAEINGLMRLLRIYLARKMRDFKRRNIRLMTIGNTGKLPAAARELLCDTIEKTASHTGMIMTLALSYGGRDEIVRATQKIVRDQIAAEAITAKLFSSYLDTQGQPDPDLLIRTSGEMRISNFLLWQMAYTELVVTPVYWPDFSVQDLYAAIHEYQGRQRRFGGIEGDDVKAHHPTR